MCVKEALRAIHVATRKAVAHPGWFALILLNEMLELFHVGSDLVCRVSIHRVQGHLLHRLQRNQTVQSPPLQRSEVPSVQSVNLMMIL